MARRDDLSRKWEYSLGLFSSPQSLTREETQLEFKPTSTKCANVLTNAKHVGPRPAAHLDARPQKTQALKVEYVVFFVVYFWNLCCPAFTNVIFFKSNFPHHKFIFIMTGKITIFLHKNVDLLCVLSAILNFL